MRRPRGQVNIPQALVALAVTVLSSIVFWWGGSTWKKAELAEDYRRRLEAVELADKRHEQAEEELRKAALTLSLKTEAIQVSVEAQGRQQATFIDEVRSYLRPRRGAVSPAAGRTDRAP